MQKDSHRVCPQRFLPRTDSARIAVWGLFLVLSGTASGAMLVDVQSPDSLSQYVLSDCRAQLTRTDGALALWLIFGHARPWSSVKFVPERLGYSTDWSGNGYLAVTVSNPSDATVRVNIRVDSQAVNGRGRQGGTELMPRRKTRLLLPLSSQPEIIGMRGQPPVPYASSDSDVCLTHNHLTLDSARIRQFQIFTARSDQDHTILVHRIALIGQSASTNHPFVDRFGQYTGADWPGKLHSEDEFSRRIRDEKQYFQTHPPLADRDQYGGWTGGPRQEATGRFRVTKYAGQWWLVDPDGRLFWSNGIDCVRFNDSTIVTGREFCFTWLPDKQDPLAQFYGGWSQRRLFDFFQANTFRKYGTNHTQRFYDVTMERFRSWGINTLGCWSSPDAWRRHKVAYTIPVHVPHAPMFEAVRFMKAGLEKKKWFPDPFDPKFQAGLERELAGLAEFQDDPWLIGVFIQNELPWTLGAPWRRPDQTPRSISLLCLQKNGGSLAAKHALLGRLQTTYPSIAELNRAWSTDFADWTAMEHPFELTDAQRKKARQDLVELDRLMAEQYFRVCRDAMDKKMPGVLYLGCRFSGAYDRHFVEVAKRYCDVVSFNIYEERPSGWTVDELAAEFDFPVMIGEFHFGALDRGMFHPGLRPATDQQARAAKYVDYVREAAGANWCVGAHWFQYLDQPLTGRTDGENYNIGFVDATDDPYPELREAARAVNEHLYDIRSAQSTGRGRDQ